MKENLEKKNTVSSKNQIEQRVFFEGKQDGKLKVMFVGNSITRHGIKEDIGWFGDWGMAASSRENDYVHKAMSAISKDNPDTSYCIVQCAVWERNYKSFDEDEYFAEAKNFNPDVIVSCLSANIPSDEFEADAFVKSVRKLHNYLAGDNCNVKILQSTSFFNNEEKTEGIKKYCEAYDNVTLVDVSHIAIDKENLAYGKFEHKGIQVHPGDKGMALLAESFVNAYKNIK